MGTYNYNIASDNALCEKVVWHANSRRLSVENFDGENVDELIKICQIRQYFSPSKFCAIRYGKDGFVKENICQEVMLICAGIVKVLCMGIIR